MFDLTFYINAGNKFYFNDLKLILPNDYNRDNFNKIDSLFAKLKDEPYSYTSIEKILKEVENIALTDEYDSINAMVEENILNDIIGDVEVDYKTGNLVEQGFIFKRLKYAHVCGCGESFTPVKDIPADGKQRLGWH